MKVKKRKEKRMRVTWVDVLLLLLAFSAFVSGVIYLRWSRNTAAEKEIRCLIRVPCVERSLLELHGGELIPRGSAVWTENGTAELGWVREIRVLPHRRAVLREGAVSWESDEERVDLELTVVMRGVLREGDGIRVKDLRIVAGGKGNLRIGPYLASGSEILSVGVKNA